MEDSNTRAKYNNFTIVEKRGVTSNGIADKVKSAFKSYNTKQVTYEVGTEKIEITRIAQDSFNFAIRDTLSGYLTAPTRVRTMSQIFDEL